MVAYLLTTIKPDKIMAGKGHDWTNVHGWICSEDMIMNNVCRNDGDMHIS